MKKFNADRFLSNLIEDVVSSAREGKQFEADPSILGPLLLSVQNELTLLSIHYEALKDRSRQVRKEPKC